MIHRENIVVMYVFDNCKRSLILVPLLVLTFVTSSLFFTGCSDSPYFIDDPRSEEFANAPVPSPDDWVNAREILLERLNETKFSGLDFLSDTGKLDYFVSNHYWYATVASKQGIDTGAYAVVVGWFRSGTVALRFFEKDYSLNMQSIQEYRTLRDANRLWTLFESGEFWTDTLLMEALYQKSGSTFDGGHMATILRGLQSRRIPRAASGSSISHSSWMAYMAAIASHVFDSSLIQPISDGVPTKSVDFVAHQEKWFFEFLSVTYDSKFAWSAIVGKHLGDRIMYRFVGIPLNYLESDKVSEYKSAAKVGDIFTLTEQSLESDKVESYQQLWHDASTTSKTRVWRVGQDN